MEIKKDKLGPEYVLRVYDPKIGMEGFLVIDNTLLGPGKGGIRMTNNVNIEEVFRLARAMSFKTALFGLPFGGAKAGIVWKGGSDSLKKQFVQSFAKLIKPLVPCKYIAGPDVNTGEKEMQWFVEATGKWRSATGKPKNLCVKEFKGWKEKCGLPHELGSTGFGVAQATKVATEVIGMDIRGAKVSIHGFGNVGTFTCQFLTEMGVNVVALADRSGTIYSESGLDAKIISKLIQENGEVNQYKGKATMMSSDDLWKIPVDILIPASVTDVINENNKAQIQAKIIVEAGNIPMSEKIETEFFDKGILIVPDFVANAGGVISSYAEYKGYHSEKMFDIVARKIQKTTRAVLEQSVKKGKNPRQVALSLAEKRMEKRIS